MAALTTPQKIQIGFHLSQCGITFVDSQLDIDFQGIDYILGALSRVESAYSVTLLTAGTLIEDEQKIDEQDITTTTVTSKATTTTTYGDRTERSFARPSYRNRISEYHFQVEGLGRSLGIVV